MLITAQMYCKAASILILAALLSSCYKPADPSAPGTVTSTCNGCITDINDVRN